MYGKSNMETYTAICKIANGNLLLGSGNSNRGSGNSDRGSGSGGMGWEMGGRFMGEGIYVYVSAGGCEWLTKHGRKELPHVRGQGQRPREPGCDGAGTAERSYPEPEVSGGSREETPRVRGQWWPGGDTPRPKSGWWPRGATLCPRSGMANLITLGPQPCLTQ